MFPSSDSLVSIIIPGYNEEKRILTSLERLSAFCGEHFRTYEIVFVDDGSKDRTREIVTSFGNESVRVVAYDQNQGKGFAVKKGMLAARGKYRFFTDADLPYDLTAFLEAMHILLNRPCEVVAGARDHPESADRSGQTLWRRTASKIFSAMVRLMLNVEIKDTQCGFKGFTAEAAEKLFSLTTIKGYAFDVELLTLAQALDLKVCKVPVALVERHHSKVRMSLDAPMMFRDVLKLCIRRREQEKKG
jgi:dolichyl-phosphate beta-glucosyltransferase